MKDISYANGRSIVIYGPPGIGKTSLAFAYPAKKRFAFDFEAGLSVVKNVPASVFRVVSYPDMVRGIDWLWNDDEHDVVICDTLTECGRVVQVQSQVPNAPRVHPELSAQLDFYLTLERLRNLFRRMRLLIQKGKTVIFTAAESIDKDQSGMMKGGPELPGKQMSPEVCYLADEVYRMFARSVQGGTERLLTTQPDSIYYAKSRVPSAPAQVTVQKANIAAAWNHLLKG